MCYKWIENSNFEVDLFLTLMTTLITVEFIGFVAQGIFIVGIGQIKKPEKFNFLTQILICYYLSIKLEVQKLRTKPIRKLGQKLIRKQQQ